MRLTRYWPIALALFFSPACGQALVEFPNPDGGSVDTARPDRAGGDTDMVDGSSIDAPAPSDGRDGPPAEAVHASESRDL